MLGRGRRMVRRTARRTARRQGSSEPESAPPPQQYAAPAPPPPAPAAEPDYMAEIEKLSQLKTQGVISEEEFEAKKKQILGI